MSSQFRTGYVCNLLFYTFEGIAAIIMSFIFKRIPIEGMAAYAIFLLFTVVSSIRASKMPELNYTRYGKLQIIAYVINSIFLSISFDSAQVFIYAMCFSSILIFTFINNKLARFQMITSFLMTLIFAFVIGIYINSGQTMREYSFGMVVLLVMNIIILSMTLHINFQNRRNLEQEKSLDDLIKVIEVKCDQLKEATNSKSVFLAQMSHEIRTPINAVIGMNEMILRESRNPEIRSYAIETKNAADSLLSIINDILDITKIEAGRLMPVPVEYKTENIIRDIYNLIRFKADEKNLEFNVIIDENIPSMFVGDDMRLKQVIINLLSNAVKYTHEGSITLEMQMTSDDEMYVSVRDTGIGIKQEHIGKLFAAFNRVDEKRNRNIEGTGLGLPITAALLGMFGSQLNVKSIYGVGSDFSFSIIQQVIDPSPIGKIDLEIHSDDYKEHHTEFVAPNAQLLIVDDNDINRKVFINLLKGTKINIDEADSGAECLKLVAKKHYDIIFMDHMMPGMDGVETLAEMKKLEKNKCNDTPVIALTANAVVGAKEFYLREGFDGFLPKPINPDKLEKIIFALLDDEVAISKAVNEAEQAEEEELPVITGIDWSFAQSHFGDRDSLLSAVRMFYKAIVSDAGELTGYYENIKDGDNLKQYRVKVHSMKSSAALVGIIHLSGMAMELEAAAKNEDAGVISSLHPIFIERWLGFRELLKEFTDANAATKDASLYNGEIQEIFGKIREAAAALDVDMLDEMSAKLDEYIFDDETSKNIQQVKNAIFNFEVDVLQNCEY